MCNYYLLCNLYYWNMFVSDLSCKYRVLCTLVLDEVTCSPLLFTFCFSCYCSFIIFKRVSTTKGFLKKICVSLLELASM